eukprot:403340412
MNSKEREFEGDLTQKHIKDSFFNKNGQQSPHDTNNNSMINLTMTNQKAFLPKIQINNHSKLNHQSSTTHEINVIDVNNNFTSQVYNYSQHIQSPLSSNKNTNYNNDNYSFVNIKVNDGKNFESQKKNSSNRNFFHKKHLSMPFAANGFDVNLDNSLIQNGLIKIIDNDSSIQKLNLRNNKLELGCSGLTRHGKQKSIIDHYMESQLLHTNLYDQNQRDSIAELGLLQHINHIKRNRNKYLKNQNNKSMMLLNGNQTSTNASTSQVLLQNGFNRFSDCDLNSPSTFMSKQQLINGSLNKSSELIIDRGSQTVLKNKLLIGQLTKSIKEMKQKCINFNTNHPMNQTEKDIRQSIISRNDNIQSGSGSIENLEQRQVNMMDTSQGNLLVKKSEIREMKKQIPIEEVIDRELIQKQAIEKADQLIKMIEIQQSSKKFKFIPDNQPSTGFLGNRKESIVAYKDKDVQKDYLDKHNLQSNIKFENKERLREMNTKFDYRKVRESHISLNVLYNDSINKLKLEEKEFNKEPQPLTFSFKNVTAFTKTIRFEILGQNAQIEALIDENDFNNDIQLQQQEKDEDDQDIQGLKVLSQNSQNPNSKDGSRDGRKKGSKNFQIQIKINEEIEPNTTTNKQRRSALQRRGTMRFGSLLGRMINHRISEQRQDKNDFSSPLQLNFMTPQNLLSTSPKRFASPLQVKEVNNQFKDQLSPSWVKQPTLKLEKRKSTNSGGGKQQNKRTPQNKELRLEMILEQNTRERLLGNKVINVDIKQQRLKKLNKVTQDLQNLDTQLLNESGLISPQFQSQSTNVSPRLQLDKIHNFQKQKLFTKWYLSPTQFSDRCKLIEQKSKPSQERDKNFQDQKTVKDLMAEIKNRYQVPEIEMEHSSSEEDDVYGEDNERKKINSKIGAALGNSLKYQRTYSITKKNSQRTKQ